MDYQRLGKLEKEIAVVKTPIQSFLDISQTLPHIRPSKRGTGEAHVKKRAGRQNTFEPPHIPDIRGTTPFFLKRDEYLVEIAEQ